MSTLGLISSKLLESMKISNNERTPEVYQVTHLVPLSTVPISSSRFVAIGNGVDVTDGLDDFNSKDLAARSVWILLYGFSVDMVVKREYLAPVIYFESHAVQLHCSLQAEAAQQT